MSGKGTFDDVSIASIGLRAKVGYLRLVPREDDDFVCSYLRFSAQ